ncbi:MAG: hypothetical protein JW839_23055 [Candidatus Lokiarchaeota archaeon]|nr:hypothetical protein [Candidatus Lokiarchaeota archaeon]
MVDSKIALLEDITKELSAKCKILKHAYFTDDGTPVFSTMSQENTEKMGKLVKFNSRQMQINNYFEQSHSNESGNKTALVLYRLSESVFLVVISESPTEDVTGQLMEVFKRYAKRLDILFHEVPKTFKDITRYLVIAQALSAGPEPVAFYPEDIPPDVSMKIAVKSMLMLTAEKQGAIRGIPATIPFIEYQGMAVIYLFDVPNKQARGGAYDSCISILVDESYRPAIYENMYAIENSCVEASEMIRAGKEFKGIVDFLLDKLGGIDLRRAANGKRSPEIEGIMKEAAKRISRELAYR